MMASTSVPRPPGASRNATRPSVSMSLPLTDRQATCSFSRSSAIFVSTLTDWPPGAEMVQIVRPRSEEHTFELQSLMRITYAVFCLNTLPPDSPRISMSRLLTSNQYYSYDIHHSALKNTVH